MQHIELKWDGVGVIKTIALVGNAKLGTLEDPIVTFEGEGFPPLSFKLGEASDLAKLLATIAATYRAACIAKAVGDELSSSHVRSTELASALIQANLDVGQHGLVRPTTSRTSHAVSRVRIAAVPSVDQANGERIVLDLVSLSPAELWLLRERLEAGEWCWGTDLRPTRWWPADADRVNYRYLLMNYPRGKIALSTDRTDMNGRPYDSVWEVVPEVTL